MTGATPEEMIKYFGPRKKLFKIHFRNVSAPLPHFSETLIDDGYYDMSKVMQALVDVEFDGIVIPDHVPNVGGAPGAAGPRGRRTGRRPSAVPAEPGLGVSARLHARDVKVGAEPQTQSIGVLDTSRTAPSTRSVSESNPCLSAFIGGQLSLCRPKPRLPIQIYGRR